MRRADRSGFTLVEVLVALSLGATVLLGARTLLEALGDHTARAADLARAADGDANAEHAARSIAARLRLADPAPAVEGGAREARFASWCETPHNWLEPCAVRLVVEADGERVCVVMELSTGERIVLRRGVAAAELRYLASAEAGGVWWARWPATLAVPLGVAVISDRDTMLLRIGERR
jgi:prepilin-type N-terminal cleavage/methylation domain-containing protein